MPARTLPRRGLVVLVTSPRVAPGVLTWPAWQTLRAAVAVLAGSASHPQIAELGHAGVAVEVVPAEPAAARAGRLIRLADTAAGPVVWLAAHSGEDDLLAAIGGSRATVLQGCHDLPGSRMLDLVATMDALRTRCPWDAKQTHRSLARYLIEESYETLEALETGDSHALRDELGDVLLQVVFHARIAAERADGTGFTIDDVCDAIVAKLVRRHPHVFGDVQVSGADEVKANWTAIKAAEREQKQGRRGSALDGIPFGQPALSLAAELQGRAASAGAPRELTDLDGAGGGPGGTGPGGAGAGGAYAGAELGGALFALVAAARAAGLDPEFELRAAARRFSDRFRIWEAGQPSG